MAASFAISPAVCFDTPAAASIPSSTKEPPAPPKKAPVIAPRIGIGIKACPVTAPAIAPVNSGDIAAKSAKS